MVVTRREEYRGPRQSMLSELFDTGADSASADWMRGVFPSGIDHGNKELLDCTTAMEREMSRQ